MVPAREPPFEAPRWDRGCTPTPPSSADDARSGVAVRAQLPQLHRGTRARMHMAPHPRPADSAQTRGARGDGRGMRTLRLPRRRAPRRIIHARLSCVAPTWITLISNGLLWAATGWRRERVETARERADGEKGEG